MDKRILALVEDDEKDERLFRHTVAVQKQAETLKQKIQETYNKLTVSEKNLKNMEDEVSKIRCEWIVLDNQEKQLLECVENRASEVLQKEHELKILKFQFKKYMRETVTTMQRLPREITEPKTSGEKESKLEQENEQKRRIWMLEGEINALKMYESYQSKKVQEMENIEGVLKDYTWNDDSWENIKHMFNKLA
ncbi:uncharacterized protein LOC115874392 [Sitophilus oryzae]|uniref:Uncharacterized protein LOC115874392 n=1 Tax=Sitophilus oryzae TaxID=7048 RepID=A0A6J2X2H8_SITOR|nr:uncharacterized protein LOC115874392 [Sitophilus oryzae]